MYNMFNCFSILWKSKASQKLKTYPLFFLPEIYPVVPQLQCGGDTQILLEL